MEYQLKDSGVEWLGEIPEHWEVDKISYRYDNISSGTTPSTSNQSYYFNGHTKWLQTGDLTDGDVKETSKSLTSEALEKYSTLKIYPTGSLVMAMYGATIGKLGILKATMTTNQACCVFPANEKVYTKFMFYNLMASRSEIINMSYGGGQPNISQKLIRNLRTYFPPKQEQTAIAEYLDQATEKIDQTIATKEAQLDTLTQYRKSLIQEKVTKGLTPNPTLKDSGVEWLGEIPEHWEVDRIKDISKLRTDKTSEKSEVEDYIELEDMSQWTGKILSFRSTIEVESSVTLFEEGDVLFGKLRPYLAKYALADREGKCTGEILAIFPERVHGSFLKYYLGSSNFIKRCDDFSYGAKMPRISWNKQLNTFEIPLPPKAEQIAIAEYLDQATEKIDSTSQNLRDQIDTLKKYRKSLIQEVVTGRKRVYHQDLTSTSHAE